MKKILYIVNIILFLILVGIIEYPAIQRARIVKARIAFYPSVASFPLFVAQQKEFFKGKNMEVQIFSSSSPELLDNLKKGKIDIVVGFPPVDFFIREKGEAGNFKIIADVEADTSYPYASIFAVGRRLRKINDIKRSLLFVPAQKLEGKVLGRKFEERFGFDVKNLFEYATPLPQIKEGATLVYEPFRSFLVKNKQRILVDGVFQKFITSPYIIGDVLVSKVTLVYKKRALERFISIWDEAVDWIRNNPEEANKLFVSFCIQHLNAEFLSQMNSDTLKLKMPKYKKTAELNDIPYLSIIRVLRNTGFIFTEPDLSKVFKLE